MELNRVNRLTCQWLLVYPDQNPEPSFSSDNRDLDLSFSIFPHFLSILQ